MAHHGPIYGHSGCHDTPSTPHNPNDRMWRLGTTKASHEAHRTRLRTGLELLTWAMRNPDVAYVTSLT